MAVEKRFECPVDDICDCSTGVCERARKLEADRAGLQAELDQLEKPYEITLDEMERGGY